MKSKIITKILKCMIICLSFISFTSCSNKKYVVTYLTDTNANVEAEDINLITLKEGLNIYINSSRFLSAANNVLEKMKSYSYEFFSSKMLFIINLSESTGSSKISVEKIDYSNLNATITLKREVPNISIDSIKVWSIFIEDNIQEVKSVKYIFKD